jgi:hypothetical protein
VHPSSSWEKNITPDRAFDGNRETCWNSGGYAPAWIEADLGAPTPLANIVLIPAQDIAGATTCGRCACRPGRWMFRGESAPRPKTMTTKEDG